MASSPPYNTESPDEVRDNSTRRRRRATAETDALYVTAR